MENGVTISREVQIINFYGKDKKMSENRLYGWKVFLPYSTILTELAIDVVKPKIDLGAPSFNYDMVGIIPEAFMEYSVPDPERTIREGRYGIHYSRTIPHAVRELVCFADTVFYIAEVSSSMDDTIQGRVLTAPTIRIEGKLLRISLLENSDFVKFLYAHVYPYQKVVEKDEMIAHVKRMFVIGDSSIETIIREYRSLCLG